MNTLHLKRKLSIVLLVGIIMTPLHGICADVYVYFSSSFVGVIDKWFFGNGWECTVGNKTYPKLDNKQYFVARLDHGSYYLVCEKSRADDVSIKFNVKNDDVYIDIDMDALLPNSAERVLDLPEGFHEDYTKVN